MERTTRADFLALGGRAALALTLGGRLALDAADAFAAAPLAHRYHSRPDLLPPRVVTTHRPGRTAPGLLFTAPSSGPGHRGTYLIDDAGEPVWFHSTRPLTAMNARAAVWRGRPVLTWWEGHTEHGLGTGRHVVIDSSYRVVAHLPAGNRHPSDLHEFLITPRGTALVSAWEHREADLTKYGGTARGIVVGGILQELELHTGRVLFEWKSLDHVGLDESHVTPGREFHDYFHINSIDLDEDGNYLVSARNTWGMYKVSHDTGKVLWRLGGRKSDFTMGPGTAFAFQHDARHHPGDVISVFDNGGFPYVQPQSQALFLKLDHRRKHASLQRRIVHHPAAHARALGSVQLLPNGNVLVGWGTEPYFSEHAPDGTVVLEAHLPRGGQNYRALRFPWRGTPTVRPAIATRGHAGGHLVHASWNGATEVDRWLVEAGPRPGALSPGAIVRRQAFETTLNVPAGPKVARVVALDADGKRLRRSKIVAL